MWKKNYYAKKIFPLVRGGGGIGGFGLLWGPNFCENSKCFQGGKYFCSTNMLKKC